MLIPIAKLLMSAALVAPPPPPPAPGEGPPEPSCRNMGMSSAEFEAAADGSV